MYPVCGRTTSSTAGHSGRATEAKKKRSFSGSKPVTSPRLRHRPSVVAVALITTLRERIGCESSQRLHALLTAGCSILAVRSDEISAEE
jgi:hypothetical protein